jgi:hypothetical protein
LERFALPRGLPEDVQGALEIHDVRRIGGGKLRAVGGDTAQQEVHREEDEEDAHLDPVERERLRDWREACGEGGEFLLADRPRG